MKLLRFLAIAFTCISNLDAQEEDNSFNFERIEDNSFLIEEAYNQEPGVIQHISTFQYLNNRTWVYSFTQEWPVPRQTHQLSFTIPILKVDATGIGDIALNYRFQALFRNRIAVAPRISLLLPTGDYKKGTGNGVLGYQFNLPVSTLISRKFVTHYNLGITIIPHSKFADGSKANISNINYGASIIYLLSEKLNFMFEAVGNTIHTASDKKTVASHYFFINPGLRYAINFKSGLQIVPGAALPIGFGSYAGNYGMFLYLSFEHPLWKSK